MVTDVALRCNLNAACSWFAVFRHRLYDVSSIPATCWSSKLFSSFRRRFISSLANNVWWHSRKCPSSGLAESAYCQHSHVIQGLLFTSSSTFTSPLRFACSTKGGLCTTCHLMQKMHTKDDRAALTMRQHGAYHQKACHSPRKGVAFTMRRLSTHYEQTRHTPWAGVANTVTWRSIHHEQVWQTPRHVVARTMRLQCAYLYMSWQSNKKAWHSQ